MGLLTVSRDRGYPDLLRQYRILVDGLEIGRVRAGGEITREVENGVHTVQARIDWCGSREIQVHVPPEGCRVRVRSALRGWRLLFALPTVVSNRDGYLLIESSANE